MQVNGLWCVVSCGNIAPDLGGLTTAVSQSLVPKFVPKIAVNARPQADDGADKSLSRPTAVPVEMDCHFESICESCSFFVTTIEFRPTLQRQRDDAAHKGQIGRQNIFDGILHRLDTDAS